MIVLDTNVVSAMMNIEGNPVIKSWLDRTDRTQLAITVITIFEVRFGIDNLPPGRRRDKLDEEFHFLMDGPFSSASNVFPLDAGAAEHVGRIHANRKAAGSNIDLPDTLIADIAISRGLPIVTRNVRHFTDVPVSTFNPWAQPT